MADERVELQQRSPLRTEETPPSDSEKPQERSPLSATEDQPTPPSKSLKRKASQDAVSSESALKIIKQISNTSEDPKPKSTEPPLPDEPPPLPDEDPPLPDEPLPDAQDDGWQPVWDTTAQTYYFYNRFTQKTQWENPRVPDAASAALPTNHDRIENGAGEAALTAVRPAAEGGYNPAIHGDYDPNADYAQLNNEDEGPAHDSGVDTVGKGEGNYDAAARFNRFTGRFQHDGLDPENFNDENKSRRQMSAFFDVDSAANRHDGRSLKAERQSKRLTKKEVAAFKKKQIQKKEEKKRAWLMD